MTAAHSPKSGCEISGTRVRGLPSIILALKVQGMWFYVTLFSHRYPTRYVGRTNFNNSLTHNAITFSFTVIGVVI